MVIVHNNGVVSFPRHAQSLKPVITNVIVHVPDYVYNYNGRGATGGAVQYNFSLCLTNMFVQIISNDVNMLTLLRIS